jgi:hypothetical protein
MTNDKERLEVAKWIFERSLGWIATADNKVVVAVAIDTAMIGGLAAAFSASDAHSRTAWACLSIICSTGGFIFALFCAAMAAIPRMLGPVSSMIFFARISEKSEADYVGDFSRLTESQLLHDLTTQIHRNSQIATAKHKWVRKSLIWSFFAIAPWIAAVAQLVKS